MLRTAVAVAAALVALAFSMSTFERWLERGRRHELAWSISLGMFAVASAALAAGADGGWNGVTFRTFFLFGAILECSFPGAGHDLPARRAAAGRLDGRGGEPPRSLRRRRHRHRPLHPPLPHNELAQGSKVFGLLPRVLAGVSSGVGALVVFAGAVWSAVRVRRARVVVANLLIAAGTAIVGASGLLNSVVDAMTAFAVTLLIGISVLFCGFLVATTGTAGSTGAGVGGGAAEKRRPGIAGKAGPGGATDGPPNRTGEVLADTGAR